MENNNLTYKIIGCAMTVHQKMGPGFQEVIYQRCLAIELEKGALGFFGNKSKPFTSMA
jgi:GxxExxY protein